MTREELKEHCKKQVEQIEMWAKHRGEEPSGRIYEEHKLVLELFEQEPKWIPVSERLPKKNVEVLATTEWGAVTIAEIYSANDWFIHEGTTNAEIDEIVAWMPLPKPYKPKESEKE